MTFLKCMTSVSMESTVSTSRRSCHSPRGHSLRLLGSPLGGMEAGVAEDNHALFKLPNQPLKGIVCDIGRGTRPGHYQPPLVQHQTEFPPDNPAMIGEAFAADVLGTPSFAHGVDQLDAVGVDHPEHGWSGQEDLRPVLMGLQQTKEPRPLSGRRGNNGR